VARLALGRDDVNRTVLTPRIAGSPAFTVLVAVFATSLITANITAVKLVRMAGLVVPSAAMS
jgi:hypothetical protein